MTAKMHHAVMHVVNQLKCQGPGAFFQEFWIERMIWYLKLYLKDRVKDSGEIIFVDDHLLVQSAMSCRCVYPELCLTLAERNDSLDTLMSPPEYDEVCDGVLLLGKRVSVPAAQVDDVMAEAVAVLVERLPGLMHATTPEGVVGGMVRRAGVACCTWVSLAGYV